jgi:hypothetical protein
MEGLDLLRVHSEVVVALSNVHFLSQLEVITAVSHLEQQSVKQLESLVLDSRDIVFLPDEKLHEALQVRGSARFPVQLEVISQGFHQSSLHITCFFPVSFLVRVLQN